MTLIIHYWTMFHQLISRCEDTMHVQTKEDVITQIQETIRAKLTCSCAISGQEYGFRADEEQHETTTNSLANLTYSEGILMRNSVRRSGFCTFRKKGTVENSKPKKYL